MQLGLLVELALRWLRRDLLVVNVSGESMLPAVRPSDVLLCSRSFPRYSYAIVVDELAIPMGPVVRHIKRITGLAGDQRNNVRISPGFVWVEGDNRAASTDSRQFGPIPSDRLVAVALAALRANHLIDLRPRIRGRKRDVRSVALEAWRDWSRGIATRGVVRPDAYGFSPASVHAYFPTPWDVARIAFDSLRVGPADVFVDYGCGRGRVLVMALEHAFQRVVGIELLSPLVETARRNLARYGSRCEIIQADASVAPLPDDVTVGYIANSFGPESLGDVVRRIEESLERRPRPFRLLTYGIDPAALSSLLDVPPRMLATHLLLYDLGPRRASSAAPRKSTRA